MKTEKIGKDYQTWLEKDGIPVSGLELDNRTLRGLNLVAELQLKTVKQTNSQRRETPFYL